MISNILIVGGTGYLGSELTATLQNEFSVKVTGRNIRDESNYIQIDFSDPSTFQNIKEKFDLIIILAASINGLGNTNLNNQDLHTNTIGLATFLQYVSNNNITQRIIYSSSMTVYALPKELPVKEMSGLAPISVYGLSKKIAEDIMSFFLNNNNVTGLVLRLPGIYGGNRKAGFIYNTIKKAIFDQDIQLNTKGLGYWESMHVNDICSIIAQLVRNYKWDDNQVINVGYGKKNDFIEVAKKIVTLLESSSKLIYGSEKGYVDFFLDNQKLLELVTIENSFEDSLSLYIKSVKNELRYS